jgi:hypothetical protein
MRRTLIAVTALPESLFWRENVGTFRTMDGRVVKIGVPGAADLIGAHQGRPVAIETKTLTGQQRDNQERWQKAWERAGGIYILARSPEDAVAELTAFQLLLP